MDTQVPLNLPEAPSWALNLGIAGKFFVFFACALFVLSALLLVLRPGGNERLGNRLFALGCLSVFGAFLSLAVLFVSDQFEFQYIFSHSDALAEMRYKVAAIWSGQEGSFLLWGVCSAVFGLVVAPRTGEYRRWFTVSYAVFLCALTAILAYESPFQVQLIEGKALLPPTGMGMAPSLLNYWVTIHPPTIFLGFGSLAVLFCWSLSALLKGDLKTWVPMIRPWAILSTTLLGIGLCMGGFWAYETLGWGGFWAWDPVENVSFVPWCLCVAFLHGLFVQIAKQKWQFGNALLAGSTFIAFVYGTFMTRSGLLGDTSVHSFAEMDRSALRLLLAILGISLVSFVVTSIVRYRKLAQEAQGESTEEPPAINKKNAYGLAIWLMVAFAITAGIGMSFPLFLALAGEKPRVVEAPLYHKIFSGFFLLTMVGMAAGPWLSWRGTPLKALLIKASNLLAITIGLLGLIVIWIKNPDHGVGIEPGAVIDIPFGRVLPLIPWMATLIGFCLFAFLSNLWFGIERIKKSRGSLGGMLVHLGVIVTMTGLIVSRGFEKTVRIGVQEGHPGTAFGHLVTYRGPTTDDFFNRENKIRFGVDGPTGKFDVTPGLYYMPRQDQEPAPMVWPYIHGKGLYDLYFSLGPMVFEATDPLTFHVGDQKVFEEEQILLTYKRMTTEGTPGTVGVKFGAEILFQSPEGTRSVTPTFQVGKDGPVFGEVLLNDSLSIRLLRIDAKDKAVTVQLMYSKPLFPMEIFYKPMTILVWTGAGIMTFGGLWAAWYRRIRKSTSSLAADSLE